MITRASITLAVALLCTTVVFLSFLTSSHCATTYSNPSITVWGRNLVGSLGYPILASSIPPIELTHFTEIFSNNYTWNVAYGLSNVITTPTVITGGVTFTTVLLSFRNGTDNSLIGQTILMAGDNSNIGFGYAEVPYYISNYVTLGYYRQDKIASNPLRNKEVNKINCYYTCILATTDNLVYVHQLSGFGLAKYDVPTTFFDPIIQTSITANIAQVYVGGSFNEPTYFALMDTGHVFSWGGWGDGLRGHTPGNTLTIPIPTLVPTLRNVLFMTINGYSAGVINSTYHALVWGSNSNGGLGIGNTGSNTFSEPQLLPLDYPSEKPIKISFGFGTGTVLTEKKNVFVFGLNSFGEASSGFSFGGSFVYTPYNLTSLINSVANARGINGGILDVGRSNYAGFCLYGVNGAASLISWGRDTERGRALYDIREVDIGGDNITSEGFLTLYGYSLISGNSGKFYAFGSNFFGQMGYGDYKQVVPSPLTPNGYYPFTADVKQVQVRSTSSCSYINIIYEGGNSTLHNWGYCLSLSLNTNDVLAISPPKQVNATQYYNSEIVDLRISTTNGLILTSEGKVYGWGSGAYYQFGSDYTSSIVFNPIDVFLETPSWTAQKIATGYHFIGAQLSNGSIVVRGAVGNFGAPIPSPATSWTLLDISNATTAVNEIMQDFVICYQTFYILTKSGKVFAIGDNSNYRIVNNGASKVYSWTRLGNGIIGSKKIIKMICGNLPQFLSDDGIPIYYIGGTSDFKKIPNSELVVDMSVGDDVNHATLYVTNRGNIYANGYNQYLQSVPNSPYLSINEPLLAYPKQNGRIPLAIDSGEAFNVLITVDEWQCFGKNASSVDACSGNGFCVAADSCRCFSKYSGTRCQIPLYYPPTPMEDYYINIKDTLPPSLRYKMSNRIAQYFK